MDSTTKPQTDSLGTMGWLDKNIKKMMVLAFCIALAFSALMCGYVVYIFAYSDDMTIYNLAVMTAVYAAATAVSHVMGICAVLTESQSIMALTNLNNVCITVIAFILSGIHFAKATHVARQINGLTHLSNVFFMTGVGFVAMGVHHAALAFMGFRYRMHLRRPVVYVADLKLNEAFFSNCTELNKTQLGYPVKSIEV
ncbi:uncharacterized protein BcabD6B2_09970 [Babesia caballi]|uniref:Membrane protein, putative n=1 Tax=Babesia caballi TaxID=5871 RepID=A0AAV4LP40_BABCB|nr:membrane protein, putative [Babesia caballi]